MWCIRSAFHKVYSGYILAVVDMLLITYVQFVSILCTKNNSNHLIFDWVIHKIKRGRFYWDTVYYHYYYKCLHGSAPKYRAELCVPVADVAGRRQLRSASRGLEFEFEFSSLQHVKLWSTCVLFRRSLRLELTSWAYPAININSCLQALTKDISTPADIAQNSALETIIFYRLWAISALTYYLLVVITMTCLQDDARQLFTLAAGDEGELSAELADMMKRLCSEENISPSC